MVKTNHKETYYIAKKIMPKGEKQSALLPSDRWMVKNVWQSLKKVDGFKKNALKIAGGASLAMLSLGIGAASALLITSANIAVAIALTAVVGVTAFSHITAKAIKSFKLKILPKVKKDMAQRVVQFNASQLFSSWKQNVKNAQEKPKPPSTTPDVSAPSVSPTPKKSKIGTLKGLFKSAFSNNTPTKAVKKPNTPSTSDPSNKQAKP